MSLFCRDEEIIRLLGRVRAAQAAHTVMLQAILEAVSPPRATKLGLTLEAEPMEGIPMSTQAHWQLERVVAHLSPNGTVDAPPTWTTDDAGTSISVEPDGMTARFTGTHAGLVNIVVSAQVDNPATAEVETISDGATFEWLDPEAQKATTLGLSLGTEPLS